MKNILTKKENTSILRKFLIAQSPNGVEKNVEEATVELVETVLRKVYGKLGDVSTVYKPNFAKSITDGLVQFTKSETDLTLFEEEEEPLKNFSVLIEAKLNMNFSTWSGEVKEDNLKDRAKVLSQAVYYLHIIKESSEPLPSAVVIADKNEIFIVPTKMLTEYLSKDYDWEIAPNQAWKNKALFNALKKDKNVNSVHVYSISEDTNLDVVAKRLISVIDKGKNFQKISINEKTLRKAYEEFNDKVFMGFDRSDKRGNKLDTRIKKNVFIHALLGDNDVFIDKNDPTSLVYLEWDVSKKKNEPTFLNPSPTFPLSTRGFQEFFESYDREVYTNDQIKKLVEITDTLIEERERRMKGDFYTPKHWVDEAHKLISESLNQYEFEAEVDEEGNPVLDEYGTVIMKKVLDSKGKPVLKKGTKDWKDEYIVWDAAAGTKNLTRDYRFGDGKLFSSTLHDTELSISEDYNKKGVSFQYDFLNDDVVNLHYMDKTLLEGMGEEFVKLPKELFNALKNNEPILFFMNPPYAQATEQSGDTKGGVADSMIGKLMKKERYGHATMELYTQFIKRVQMFAETFDYEQDFHFFFFNKGFLTSPSFRKFTEELVNDFSFEDGFMLNAGEFSGTSSAWGVIFSHWRLKPKTDRTIENRQSEFPFTVKESVTIDGETVVVDTDTWVGKSMYEYNISNFIPSQRKKTYLDFSEYPTTANGFGKSRSKKSPRGRMFTDSIGFAHLSGSNVQFSDKYTGLYSICFHNGNGMGIAPDNFERIAVHFSVRKAWWQIIADRDQLWIRDKDIFPSPTQEFQESEDWDEFVADSVVYSLFAKGSNQTAIRNYEYGETEDGEPRYWDIKNQFFWKSLESVEALAVELDEDNQRSPNFNREVRL